MTPAWLEPLLSPWMLALFGLCIGSFLNVVIHRLPLMMEREWREEAHALAEVQGPPPPELTLWKPSSRCPCCGHQIRWLENLPVLSYVLQGGRCRSCRTPISKRYPLIELLTAVLFGLVGWRIGARPEAVLWCGFMATLVAAAGIDWDTTLLPDSLTQPLLWAGLLAGLLHWTPVSLPQAVWGAVAGYLSLWSVYQGYKLLTGKEGMGQGDFKLLAALGAWLGVQMILPIVLLASVIGAVVGMGMKLSGSLREGLYVPFGPFLAGGGITVMLAGPQRVLQWMSWL